MQKDRRCLIMSTVTTRDFHVSKSFNISPDALERIWKTLKATGPKPSISFSCAGNYTYDTDDIQTLLDYPNGPSRHLQRIEFTTTSNSPRVNLTFDGGDPRWQSDIRYVVAGDEKDVLHTADQLDNILETTYWWYSPIVSVFSVFQTLIAMITVAITGSMVAGGLIVLFTDSKAASHIAGFPPSAILIAAGVAVFVAVSCVIATMAEMFPSATFEIGGGVKRARRAATWRRVIGPGVVLALVVGVVASYIAAKAMLLR